MKDSTLEVFVLEIENFLKRYDMPPTTFGVLAMKKPGFVAKLRAGRPCLVPTMDRVRKFMAEYRGELPQRKEA